MGYVRNTYGCHCFYGDSSFKRYNRAALGDTFIFNYNSNNTYNCCGGQRGGFWGGFGMGLGMGFGNLFGGLFGGMMNGFGNMFGGFGMGNMFGGFPSFGGFGNWGFGGTPAASTVKPSTKTVTVEKEVKTPNADHQAISDLGKKYSDLLAGIKNGTIKPDEIEGKVAALKAEVAAKRGTGDAFVGDGIQDEIDTQDLDNLLKNLDNLVTKGSDGSSAIVDGNNIVLIRIAGKDINGLDDLDALANTNPDALKNLDKNVARMVLLKLGYLDDEAGSMTPEKINAASKQTLAGKFSNHYSVLLVIQAAQVAVEVEKNDGNVKDHWCTGPISNVKLENGRISYDIDCTKTGVDGFKGEYHVVSQNDGNTEFKPSKKSGNVTVEDGAIWKYVGEKQPLEKTGGASIH